MDWGLIMNRRLYGKRYSLLESVEYAILNSGIWEQEQCHNDVVNRGFLININSQGLLVLMDWAPAIDQMVRISVPSPYCGISTRTLADVRWTKSAPLGSVDMKTVCFVGLRFVFV